MESLGLQKHRVVMPVDGAVLPREGRNCVSIASALINFPDGDGPREPGCWHMDSSPHVREFRE